MKDRLGSIRKGIQGQGSGAVGAARERSAISCVAPNTLGLGSLGHSQPRETQRTLRKSNPRQLA